MNISAGNLMDFDQYVCLGESARGTEISLYTIDTGCLDPESKEMKDIFQDRLTRPQGTAGHDETEELHGTAVAALAAGTKTGVAFVCKVISYRHNISAAANAKTLESQGEKTKAQELRRQPIVEDVIKCCEDILQHYRQNPKKPKYPAVVNMSFYIANNAIQGKDNEARCILITKLGKAIEDLVEEGLIVVGAAGNVPYKSDTFCNWKIGRPQTADTPLIVFPACVKGVIGVGSLTRSGWKAKYSGWGECIEYYALGEDIKHPIWPGKSKVSGTSFATPFVAGMVAGAISSAKHSWKLNKEVKPGAARTDYIKNDVLKKVATAGDLIDGKDHKGVLIVLGEKKVNMFTSRFIDFQ